MKEIIKNIFNKVDFKIIVGTIYLASLVFSLFPDNIINYFGLLSFKSTYQFVISLIFIVLSCYYIATLIQYVYNKIKNKSGKNISGEKLYKLYSKYGKDDKKGNFITYNERCEKEAKQFMNDIRDEKKSYDEFDKWLDNNC